MPFQWAFLFPDINRSYSLTAYYLGLALPAQKNEERITNQIRKIIHGNEDLGRGLELLEKKHKMEKKQGPNAKESIAEALKSKDVGEGRNILMHAASLGHDVSFSSAVDVIAKRVSLTQRVVVVLWAWPGIHDSLENNIKFSPGWI